MNDVSQNAYQYSFSTYLLREQYGIQLMENTSYMKAEVH
jgi:hypothetical protein